MRILAFSLVPALFSLPASPAGVFLRTPGTGFCRVTNATNSSTIRITATGSCNLALGDFVIVDAVRGNLAANVNPGSGPANTAHRIRKVANLSVSGQEVSFDLTDENGAPVAGSGAYTGGGRVGKAALYTLKSGPIGYLDGTGGARTNALAGSKATMANPAYAVLRTLSDLELTKGSDLFNYRESNGDPKWGHGFASQYPGSSAAVAAMRWMAETDTTKKADALEEAKWYLDNIDQATGTSACLESSERCGTTESLLSDYLMQFWGSSMSVAYTIVKPQLSSLVKNKFLDYVFADIPWNFGGHNYTAPAPLPNVPWKFRAAVLTASTLVKTLAGTSIVNCEPVGTPCFTADPSIEREAAQVGDVIIFPDGRENVYGAPYLIVDVADTHVKVATKLLVSGTLHYQLGKRWASGERGFLYQASHHGYDPFNGGAPGIYHPLSVEGGAPANLPFPPPYAAISGFYSTPDHNRTSAQVAFKLLLGLVTCEDDPRGCVMASRAYAYINDQSLPMALSAWTGWSTSSPIYHQGRTTGPLLQAFLMVKNSFVNPPDPLAGTQLMPNAARHFIAALRPGDSVFIPNQKDSFVDATAGNMSAALAYMAYAPATDLAQNIQWVLLNFLNVAGHSYDQQFLSYASSSWVWENYMLYEPSVMALQPTQLAFQFRDSNAAVCATTFGLAECATAYPDVRRVSISRTSWQRDSTMLAWDTSAQGCRDHCADSLGGQLQIVKGSTPVMGGNSFTGFGATAAGRGMIEIDSPSNFRLYYEIAPPLPVVAASAESENGYWFMRSDLRQAYTAAAGVRDVWRQLIHFKAGGRDFVVDHAYVNVSSAKQLKWNQFYLGSSATVTRASRGGTVVNTRTVAPDAPRSIASRYVGMSNSALIDAGVSGAAVKTYMCQTATGSPTAPCVAATTGEWAAVHAIDSTTPPVVVQTNSGSFRVIEIQDPARPAVAVLSTSGTSGNSLSFTTTHAGEAQYVIAGLGNGQWSVTRDGVAVGSGQVASGDSTLSFMSGSGAISLRKGSGGGGGGGNGNGKP